MNVTGQLDAVAADPVLKLVGRAERGGQRVGAGGHTWAAGSRPAPLSWEVPRPDGAAGGITDDMDIAKKHVLEAMRESLGGAEGVIRRAYITFENGLRYGPPLVRVRRDQTSGALLIEDAPPTPPPA